MLTAPKRRQLTSISDAANDTATFTYSYGDLASITDPLSNTIRRFTDGAGRLLSLEDALGNLTAYTYDGFDRVSKIADAQGNATQFTYDLAGNLTQVKDANNNQTNYTYDTRNRRLTSKDALTKSDVYVYDGNSNVTKHTDRLNKATTYLYDALNRPTSIAFSGDTITPTFDGGNRLTKAVDSTAGTITRSYDGLDDLTQEVSPQGTINYTYDNAGRRETMQVVGQAQATYTFDNANRMTAITQGTQSVGLNYDNANRRTCLTLPNGVVTSYGYDNNSRVTALTYGTGGSCSSPPSNLGNLTYVYDANGRRTTIGGSLAAVSLPANIAGGTSTTYNADNEQTKFNNASLTYDSDGQLTRDATNTYTFDARNHLTAISGGATASFVYDALGRRMKKVVAGTTTQFLYDRVNPVQELNSSNGVVANLLTGLNTDEYFTRTASSTTSTFLTDALGSTIGLVTANNGSTTTTYTYQSFGATTIGGAANGNSYDFTGRENDGTGLCFNRARYYSSTYQRFIAQDPSEFGGGDTNLYGYVHNDPTDTKDPSGRQAAVIPAVIGCSAAPEVCATLAALTGAAALVAGAQILMSRTPHSDPYIFPKSVDPGRDSNGNCNPCPDNGPVFSQPGDAHGSTCGEHYHQIIWRQDQISCKCYSDRVDVPSPGAQK
jgi:RHS repeat-associated protein